MLAAYTALATADGPHLAPARAPRALRGDCKLLVIDPLRRSIADSRLSSLPRLLSAGDLLVVNDAATLPASLHGTARGQPVELRLVARGASDDRWTAALLGAGDWRTPTERRPAPPALAPGEMLDLGGLSATVEALRPESPRLLQLRFDRDGARLWQAIYRLGRPVQYAHLERPLALGSVQTAFAARPWAVELPSAGWSLDFELLDALRARGIDVSRLTHAAGLSAIGDPRLDRALPLPERYDIPSATVAAVARTAAAGGRVIAVGTTVVRALEASAAGGRLPRAGENETDLRIGEGYRPSVVDGLITGMHVAGESHYELLGAFCDEPLLDRAMRHAAARGYRCHEFGDATLIVERDP